MHKHVTGNLAVEETHLLSTVSEGSWRYYPNSHSFEPLKSASVTPLRSGLNGTWTDAWNLRTSHVRDCS
jgi:hypothetical protein